MADAVLDQIGQHAFEAKRLTRQHDPIRPLVGDCGAGRGAIIDDALRQGREIEFDARIMRGIIPRECDERSDEGD